MRKLLIVLLAANLGFLAVRLARDAFAGGATTTVIGDANGDLQLDIADPVYLLEHLFLGGPPPVAFAGAADLEARVAALEDLLQNFHRDGDTVVVEGANLQVVNGTGSTGSENGTGNLIVGYNEPRTGNENVPGLAPNDRSGSHNIVLGRRNNYTSHGALVTGSVNDATAPFANVLGGLIRIADEDWEVVGGITDEQAETLSSLPHHVVSNEGRVMDLESAVGILEASTAANEAAFEEFSGEIGARVSRTAAFGGNGGPVTFSDEDWDFGDLFDPSANTRLTAPVDGRYLIAAVARVAVNPLSMSLLLNGMNIAQNYEREGVESLTTVYQLSAGDYVEVSVRMYLQGAPPDVDFMMVKLK